MQGLAGRSNQALHPCNQPSTQSSGEHAYTFSELERLITEEDIDLDQINLLLDIIQVPSLESRVALEPMENRDSPN